MDSPRFLKYLTAGKSGEDLLKTQLEQRSFQIVKTGQEHWLPESMHAQIKHLQDQMSLTIRHMPDFLAFHPKFGLAFWDAKVKTTDSYPNFTLRKSFYQAMRDRHLGGQRVVIAFMDTDGCWRANWIEALQPLEEIDNRGKPFILIAKHSTHTLGIFLAVNVLAARQP